MIPQGSQPSTIDTLMSHQTLHGTTTRTFTTSQRTCVRALHRISVALQHLRRLDIHNCKGIMDVGLESIASVRQLQELHLGGCRSITDAGLAGIAPLHQLQHLDLSYCCNITDAGLSNLVATLQQL
ncbi:receptor-type protein kinase, putative, partial [Bodo saltans]